MAYPPDPEFLVPEEPPPPPLADPDPVAPAGEDAPTTVYPTGYPGGGA
jgi:hypothetical protein